MGWHSETVTEIAKSLARFQANAPLLKKDAENPHFKSSYTTLAEIIAQAKEQLPTYGLSFSQVMQDAPAGVSVRTVLLHESGEWLSGVCTLPLDRAGGPQGAGSAITYARRYSLAAILGLASEDDDAEAAQTPYRARESSSGARQPQADNGERYTTGADGKRKLKQPWAGAAGAAWSYSGKDEEKYRVAIESIIGRAFDGWEDVSREEAEEIKARLGGDWKPAGR